MHIGDFHLIPMQISCFRRAKNVMYRYGDLQKTKKTIVFKFVDCRVKVFLMKM